MALTFDTSAFRQELVKELTGNILPFWIAHVVDREHGGFYGAVTNDLQVRNDVPRSVILCARILWTYAAAYRRLGGQPYLAMARWAYDALTGVFWDREHGGLYWAVDARGKPVSDRKHHYAQAFGLYGLAEYYQATQELQCLRLAQTLFHLLEEHAYDAVRGGYLEGRSRGWDTLDDMRLSDRDVNCHKSMNTMLHILEAYTNLLRVWDHPLLRARHRTLIETFLRQILNPATGHFKLFFDDHWQSLSDHVSYGHDIEGSWLLWEAAELQGDESLKAQVCESTLELAMAVYREALDEDGSVFYEANPQGLVDTGKSWWVQTEAMVGFYNAYQLAGQESFAQAAHRCWSYVKSHMVDSKHGDWVKQLSRDGSVDDRVYKAGPWECPYHHSRACFEMLRRLAGEAHEIRPL
jgi:mannobiose 2-epimerase